MAVYKENIVDIDLAKGSLHRSFLTHTIGSGDVEADHFGVRVFRDGEPVDLTDVSVQGIFNPPQGSPIALTSGNVISGNVAAVVLKQACYNYNGQFCLSIKLVGGGVTGTMRIVDGVVDNTHSTGTVAPTEEVPTYQEVIAQYDAMVAATAAANGAIAKPYAQLTFPVKKGEYTIVDGALKRALVDIATSETYTAAHWTDAKLGPDLSQLKSAFEGNNDLIGNVNYQGTPNEYAGSSIRISMKQTGNVLLLNNPSATAETTTNKNRYYRINDGIDFQTVSQYNTDTFHLPIIIGHRYRFLVRKISGTVTKAASDNALVVLVKGLTASFENIDLTTLSGVEMREFVADASAVNIIIRTSNGITCTNFMIEVYLLDLTEMMNFIGMDDVPTEGSPFPVTSNGIAVSKLDSTYDVPIDWADGFGNDDYPLGWQTGYFNSSGATGTSDDYMRTVWRSYYTAKPGDKEIVFTVPSGYHAAIAEYDENGSNGTRHGGIDSGSNTVSVQLTEGYRYKFCIGKWDGDAGDDIDADFLENVTATVKRSFIEWQKEQDARLDAIAGASDIPEYYTAYLQTKLNTITNLQKTLSEKNDGFIFITDYHHRTNRGHSLALIKEVAKKTGLQKIFFAGDAGGRMGGDSGYVLSMQKSAQVWSDLAGCAEAFYGALGNHEWIDGSVYGKGAVIANYLNRFKLTGKGMSDNGSYYVEDPVCKIRYYFIQDSYGASALDYDWLGKSLEQIESGWYVAVIAHHGYIPGTASEDEYDGVVIDTTTASHVIANLISKILHGYQNHTTVTTTISGTPYAWDFTNTSGGGSIGVFCGHYHHGTLFPIDDEENEWGIPVWRGSTDSMQAGSVFEEYEGQKVPWYWENGVIGDTKVIRTPGTTDEQCFYAVQIDLTAKKVYITAIGGDHDWEFDFT